MFYTPKFFEKAKGLFLTLDYRVHCQESGEESSETESVYSLKCHISQEVNHLHEGLKHVSFRFILGHPHVIDSLILSFTMGRVTFYVSFIKFNLV